MIIIMKNGNDNSNTDDNATDHHNDTAKIKIN